MTCVCLCLRMGVDNPALLQDASAGVGEAHLAGVMCPICLHGFSAARRLSRATLME